MLYANDMLLILGDTDVFVRAVVSVITEFGNYSGLIINWSKSTLLPLDGIVNSGLSSLYPVPVVDSFRSFRYLGVVISPVFTDYSHLNISQTNLVKMIMMPMLLYFFTIPQLCCLKLFRAINSIFRQLLWKQSSPKIHLEQLQCPKSAQGGIEFLNAWIYFQAAQLQHMRLVCLGSRRMRSRSVILPCPFYCIIKKNTLSRSLGLEAQYFAKSNLLFPTYCLMHNVWCKAKQMQGETGFTHYSPMWKN